MKFFNFFHDIFGKSYSEIFYTLTDKLFGPTGARICAWTFLAFSIYFLVRRRISSIGMIIILYILAVFFAYFPAARAILKF